MSALYVNQIAVGAFIASAQEPTGGRRDVGSETLASDGSTRVTRQTRKRDIKFKTIFLSEGDAHTLESLIIGEGEVWSFDASLYGSKGTGPSAFVSATITAGSAKFGASKLTLAATVGTITYSYPALNMYAQPGAFAQACTVRVYRSTDGGATWVSYVVKFIGASAVAKWVDGVRNDAASTTWLAVGSTGTVTLSNTSGSAVQYDDFVVLPFLVMDDWPPQMATILTRAWPASPYLEVSGAWVTEQNFRPVFGQCSDIRTKTGGGVKVVRLDVELKAK